MKKAALLYDFLDTSKLFKGCAEKGSRSMMNVTFVTGDADLDAKFVKRSGCRRFLSILRAPFRRRDARFDLQRDADGRRGKARRFHEGF